MIRHPREKQRFFRTNLHDLQKYRDEYLLTQTYPGTITGIDVTLTSNAINDPWVMLVCYSRQEIAVITFSGRCYDKSRTIL